MITAEIGGGTPFAVWGTAVRCGADAAVTICGGTAHIGAVALAVYEPQRDSATVSTVTVYSHRDDVVAALAAKRMARALRNTVTVSVGIHLDDAGPEEIRRLQENSEACCAALLEKLKAE